MIKTANTEKSNEEISYIQQVEQLKKEIQNLIDTDQDTQEKIVELHKANDNLKNLQKEKQKAKQKLREVIAAQNVTNGIDYHRLKKGSNQEEYKTIKQTRELAKNKYLASMEEQKKYNSIDPEIMPGFLFFHTDVIEKYGLCPYVKINGDDTTEKIFEIRKKWLEQQTDKGRYFYDIYSLLIEKREVLEMDEKLIKLQNYFKNLIERLCSSSQYNLYTESVEYLREYTTSTVKTKRIKEKFKIIVNNLSILYNETNIPVHLYLSEQYQIPIKINEKKQPNVPIENLNYHLSDFSIKLDEYKNILSKLETQKKFIQNTINNLRTIQNHFLEHNKLPTNFTGMLNKDTVRQRGKYFKKWSELNNEERLDRFNSYASYFVDKKMIQTQIISTSEREIMIENFTNCLNEWYQSKRLKYKYIKWSIKGGIIENIKDISYELENKTFMFTSNEKDQEKKNNSIKKKSTQIKTIFTKENEKIINETILVFILKETETGELEVNENIKDKCFNSVKEKLKLKRITTNDKKQLDSKYDEIYSVVLKH